MEIHGFRQHEGESFNGAWERFKDLLRKCPNPLMVKGHELQIFYKGLTKESQNNLNVSAGGSLKGKPIEVVGELFQRVAENECLWMHDSRNSPWKQDEYWELEHLWIWKHKRLLPFVT